MYALFIIIALLFNERCIYNAMIEYVTIRKLKDNLLRPIKKLIIEPMAIPVAKPIAINCIEEDEFLV